MLVTAAALRLCSRRGTLELCRPGLERLGRHSAGTGIHLSASSPSPATVIPPFPDDPDAYTTPAEDTTVVSGADRRGGQKDKEKKTGKKKVVRIKTNPFDQSQRPIATLTPEAKEDKNIRSNERRSLIGWTDGAKRLNVIQPPERISATINKMLRGDHKDIAERMDQYLATGVDFRRFVAARRIPMEGRFLRVAWQKIRTEVEEKYADEIAQAETDKELFDRLELEKRVEKETKKIYDAKVEMSAWVPIEYDDRTAVWVYLLGKAAFDYAALKLVLAEIKSRTSKENSFQPRTLMDFGSGLGTARWAVKDTFGVLTEVVGVDRSMEMNTMNRTILLNGKSSDPMPAGHFSRLNFPKDTKLKYDIVTCSFSLLDIASERERINLITDLWEKTGEFLVILEVGTNAGFACIAEARHVLNHLSKVKPTAATTTNGDNATQPMLGHLYAPCAHEKKCPRYDLDSLPCNFRVRYQNFDLDAMPKAVENKVMEDNFSYVVFRKGEQTEEMWPRLIADPIRPNKGQAICQLCTKEGRLQETKASKSACRTTFNYHKFAVWGQRFKVDLQYQDDGSSPSSSSSSSSSSSEDSSRCTTTMEDIESEKLPPLSNNYDKNARKGSSS